MCSLEHISLITLVQKSFLDSSWTAMFPQGYRRLLQIEKRISADTPDLKTYPENIAGVREMGNNLIMLR